MIYTKLTKKALGIAFDVHKEQFDKSGMPYVFHPFFLACQMTTEEEVIVALLHDVVEDGDITLEDLAACGFNFDIIKALSLLTRDDDMTYMEYIEQIKQSPLAVKVKLADLNHNSDLSRLDIVDKWALKRIEKYKKAIAALEGDKK